MHTKTLLRGEEAYIGFPTYLTRENKDVDIMEPADFIAGLSNKKVAEAAVMDEELGNQLIGLAQKGLLGTLNVGRSSGRLD